MARSVDDDREIPLIERWEDMYRRPNYSQDIDGSKAALQSVLAPYLLSPLQPCGCWRSPKTDQLTRVIFAQN